MSLSHLRKEIALKLEQDITNVTEDHKKQIRIINDKQKKIKHLETHQYDPNCKFCVQNPFVQDAESAKKLLPTLQTEHDEILIKINALLQLIRHSSAEQELIEYDNYIATKSDLDGQVTGYDQNNSYINCIWFNGLSWISDKFKEGDRVAFFGKV